MVRIWKVVIPAAVMLAALLTSSALAAGENQRLADELERLLEKDAATQGFDLDGSRIPLHDGVAEFYRQRHHFPVWLEGRQLTGQARGVLEILRQAAAEGLDPEDYQASTIALFDDLNRVLPSYGEIWDRRVLIRLDLMLTNAILRYIGHLSQGRVDPAAVYSQEWLLLPEPVDPVAILQAGLVQGRVAEALAESAPRNQGYARLRESLVLYRQLAAAGGWPQIPSGNSVRPGEKDWRIPWLRHHLALIGDLPEGGNSESEVLDPETVSALQIFQSRHGLTIDGIFGPATLAELNVSVEERIRQIEFNMERSRWLPEHLGDRYLVVNIADFHLTIVENGEPVLEMAVVVGTPSRRTPVFSSRLGYLVFSPYWNVPVSILRKDKLPRIKADIDYLNAHHYQIVAWKDFPNRLLDPASLDWELINAKNFPGLLRQKPGPWNALGRVKFMLPNNFDVFLHDTPDQKLFNRKERIFSSGCIRLERPADLARYLLRDRTDWDDDRIRQAMEAGIPQRVDVAEQLPVHVLYQTAWVDRQGRLQFRRDIYQRDRDLYAALTGPPAPEKTMLAANRENR